MQLQIEALVARALEEDLGAAGDITTLACIPADARCRAVIAARADGVVAGVETAREAFRRIDPEVEFSLMHGDGARVHPGAVIAQLSGPTRAILTAERVALNFLGRLSGVATATAALVDAVVGTGAAIVCTRKTTPGLRALEKYAVRCGGGRNHRFGLYDAVLIKDNHIAAVGSIARALAAARRAVGHLVKIEIEVDTLAQFDEALAAGADIILLDNMALDDMRRAVAINRARGSARAILEASGNVSRASVRAIAETGVDVISSGAITHSAPCLDLGLDFS